MEQKTVFLSYRRSESKHLARSIYMDLKANGWDVFLDVNTIDSGDFDRIILNQIGARAHFILLISPDSLKRCANAGDWVLREIEEAVRLNRNIVPIIEEETDFSREMGYLPEKLRAVISKKNSLPLPHFYFDAAMDALRTRFLKAPEYVAIQETPFEERAEVRRRVEAIEETTPVEGQYADSAIHNLSQETIEEVLNELTPRQSRILRLRFGLDGGEPRTLEDVANILGLTRERVRQLEQEALRRLRRPQGELEKSISSKELLPAPFDWIEIPNRGYNIAKYPLTNTQFAKFIDAGGYNQEKWWTKRGWQYRQKGNWTEPQLWGNSKWNGDEQPVVGVSWYEAIAFCLWLSDITGENIMLPTERQWQYAAQGDDGRTYPWGDGWDDQCCNNSVNPCNSSVTTPVQYYQDKGSSPFGVVDMAGNIWEWCLTDYEDKMNDINSGATYRVLCGGSWLSYETYFFRCNNNDGKESVNRSSQRGFRLTQS